MNHIISLIDDEQVVMTAYDSCDSGGGSCDYGGCDSDSCDQDACDYCDSSDG